MLCIFIFFLFSLIFSSLLYFFNFSFIYFFFIFIHPFFIEKKKKYFFNLIFFNYSFSFFLRKFFSSFHSFLSGTWIIYSTLPWIKSLRLGVGLNIYKWGCGDDLGSKFSYVQIWGRGCWGTKFAKKISFLRKSIENQNVDIISKNQPTTLIRRARYWGGGYLLFDLWKQALPSPSSLQIELSCWNFEYSLVGIIDVHFGGFDSSDPLHPLTTLKKCFFFLDWFPHYSGLFLS